MLLGGIEINKWQLIDVAKKSVDDNHIIISSLLGLGVNKASGVWYNFSQVRFSIASQSEAASSLLFYNSRISFWLMIGNSLLIKSHRFDTADHTVVDVVFQSFNYHNEIWN